MGGVIMNGESEQKSARLFVAVLNKRGEWGLGANKQISCRQLKLKSFARILHQTCKPFSNTRF